MMRVVYCAFVCNPTHRTDLSQNEINTVTLAHLGCGIDSVSGDDGSPVGIDETQQQAYSVLTGFHSNRQILAACSYPNTTNGIETTGSKRTK
jgi:hypothetical protein